MTEQAPNQLHRPEVWSSVAPGYDDAIAPIMRPDLPAPPPPPWAHLGEAAGLGQALRAAGFADVAVHQVTHHWKPPDPALFFFRRLPDWTPPLRPLFASVPAEVIDRAAAGAADGRAAPGGCTDACV